MLLWHDLMSESKSEVNHERRGETIGAHKDSLKISSCWKEQLLSPSEGQHEALKSVSIQLYPFSNLIPHNESCGGTMMWCASSEIDTSGGMSFSQNSTADTLQATLGRWEIAPFVWFISVMTCHSATVPLLQSQSVVNQGSAVDDTSREHYCSSILIALLWIRISIVELSGGWTESLRLHRLVKHTVSPARSCTDASYHGTTHFFSLLSAMSQCKIHSFSRDLAGLNECEWISWSSTLTVLGSRSKEHSHSLANLWSHSKPRETSQVSKRFT
jgi:hypothetical protein